MNGLQTSTKWVPSFMVFLMLWMVVFANVSFASTSTTAKNAVTVYVKSDTNFTKLFVRTSGQDWLKAKTLSLKSSKIPGYQFASFVIGNNKNVEILWGSGSKAPKTKTGKGSVVKPGTYTLKKTGLTAGTPANNLVTVYYPAGDFEQTFAQYRFIGSSWTKFPGMRMSESIIPGFLVLNIPVGEAKGIDIRFSDGSPEVIFTDDSDYRLGLGVSTILNGQVKSGAPELKPTTPAPTPIAKPIESIKPADLNVDNTPPTKPENVRVTENDKNYVVISWDASTDNVAVSGYHLYRDNMKISSIKETQYTDDEVLYDTTYSYEVEAVDSNGKVSAKSVPVTIKTKPKAIDTVPPKAPTIKTDAKTSNSVSLQWTVSEDNVGISGYELYRDGAKILTTSDLQAVDRQNIVPKTVYKYFVKAIDLSGNPSIASNELSVEIPVITAAPEKVKNLSVFSRTENNLAILWEEPKDVQGISSYEVYRDGKLVGKTNNVYFLDANLTPGTKYKYKVVVQDISGNQSQPSDELEAITVINTAPLSAPTGLAVVKDSETDSSVKLTWAAPSEKSTVLGYTIQRDGKDIGKIGPLLTYEDKGLESSKTYEYTIKAVDAVGNASAASQKVVVTTKPAFTVYYKGTLTNNIHYSLLGLTEKKWTDLPGKPMVDAEIVGYKKFTVQLGNATGIEAAFNASGKDWDSNQDPNAILPGKNYTLLSSGGVIVTVADRTITYGKPVGPTVPTTPTTPTPVPTTQPSETEKPTVPTGLRVISNTDEKIVLSWTKSTDNVGVKEYEVFMNGTKIATVPAVAAGKVIETPQFEDLAPAYGMDRNYSVVAVDQNTNKSIETDKLKVTTANKSVVLYYKSSTSNAKLHYRLDNSLAWTEEPGLDMTKIDFGTNYYSYTVSLKAARAIAEAAFNYTVNNLRTWDNNATKNYKFEAGTWTIEGGVVKPGLPVGYTPPTTTPAPTPVITPNIPVVSPTPSITATPVITPTPTATPVSKVNVKFVVNKPTQMGQNIYLSYVDSTGTTKTELMTWTEIPVKHNWTITKALTPGQTFSYKYLFVQGTSAPAPEKEGANRTYTVPIADTTKTDTWGSY